ncbi:MFS transporter [Actinospica robiniae]|uniref:MFS transporter n=1 Tax=Actinospica robiniae TaxID=304901 RepID=UPI000423B0D4|nr:MFS transporter [Actinospica robiniae]
MAGSAETRRARPGTEAGRRRGGLLRTRDFGLLWFGETTSAMGSAITTVALPLVAVITLHASTLAVAALTAATWLPWLLIGLPAGALADRWPHRTTLLVCDVVSAVVLLSVPVAAWLHVLTYAHLLIAALLAGGSAVFFSIAYRSLLPELVPASALVEGNGALQAGAQGARFAGPGLGGTIAQAAGAVTGIAVDVMTFFVSALCLLGIRPPAEHRPRVADRRGVLRPALEGISVIRHDPYLRTLTWLPAAMNCLLQGIAALRVVFLVRTEHVPAGAAGLVIGIGSLGGVLGAMLARPAARRLGSARALLAAQAGSAPFALLLPLSADGWRLGFFALGAVAMGVGIALCSVLAGSFVQSYCQPRLLTRVVAASRVLGDGFIPVGALAAGAVGSILGVRTAMWILAVCYVLVPVALLRSAVARDRQLPARPAGEEPEAAAEAVLCEGAG